MTRKQIKERAKYLEVFGDGKAIQWRWYNAKYRKPDCCAWNELKDNNQDHLFNPSVELRIKPEPLRRWLVISEIGSELIFKTKEEAETQKHIWERSRIVEMIEVEK